MPIPKSEKLASESTGENSYYMDAPTAHLMPASHESLYESEVLQIKELFPLNDMVAILLESADTTIVLQDKDRFKNEGVVVGVGPLTSQVALGDVVLFPERSPQVLDISEGFYKGKRMVLVSERNMLMKLKSIKVEVI